VAEKREDPHCAGVVHEEDPPEIRADVGVAGTVPVQHQQRVEAGAGQARGDGVDALQQVPVDRNADVRAYLRRVLLVDDARAVRILTFLRHPLWRLTTVAYVEGAARVRAWWDADPSGARLATLLDGTLTPADLRPNEGSDREVGTTGGIREAMSGRPIC